MAGAGSFGWLAAIVGALAVAALALAAPADAETRVALVVGNSAYVHAPHLPNAGPDAVAVAAALRQAGFDVTPLQDLSDRDLQSALIAFAGKARTADIVLIYYAGHGMEVGGVNYLIPTDARLESEGVIDLETISLGEVLKVVDENTTGLKIVVLDACRENPFVDAMLRVGGATRGIERGLARIDLQRQTAGDPGRIVAFSAGHDEYAQDGPDGAESPYAAAFIRRFTTSRDDVRLIFSQIEDDVLDATQRRQDPAFEASLTGRPIYINRPAPAPAQPSLPPVNEAGADQAWQTAQARTDLPGLQAYLTAYPNSAHATDAQAKLDALRRLVPPDMAGATLVTFSAADTSARPIIDATAFLQSFGITVSPAEMRPADTSLIIVSNRSEYAGQAERPTLSQNFLTQDDPTDARAAFTLHFARPMQAVSFMLPSVFGATPSGVTVPAWRAEALDADGNALSEVSEQMLRQYAVFPAQVYTLRAPGFEGIAAVRFSSDSWLGGRPFTGFATLRIEAMALAPK